MATTDLRQGYALLANLVAHQLGLHWELTDVANMKALGSRMRSRKWLTAFCGPVQLIIAFFAYNLYNQTNFLYPGDIAAFWDCKEGDGMPY